MKTISSVADMQSFAVSVRTDGRRIGLVPTMGFLHEGHLSLIRKCRSMSDVVVVSIYVNPLQFAPSEDFNSYPRDAERDSELCRREKVDVLFLPSSSEMYASDHSTYVKEAKLSRPLCGKSRPDHFQGVTTIVAKLFNIVQPTSAVFGQKDAQQAAVIRRMVRDMNFPIEIVIAPIVREADGLAMSSRNVHLSGSDRARAAGIRESLLAAERMYGRGARDAGAVRNRIVEMLEKAGLVVDYVEVVDNDTLMPVDDISAPALVAVAAIAGETRLIDNTVLG